MGYSISYDADSRLTISGLECDCPCEHNEPTQDIYVGNGILVNLPRYIRKRNLGTHCVLVADNNTWEIAGARAAELLRTDGFTVVECVIRRDGVMDPDETAVGEVLLSLQPDTEFLVSVGSGSITDTVRVNAKRTGLPMVCIGTAPSMDGYTSVVCPLLLHGVKIHRAGKCPDIILCDIDILKTAPLSMVASGVGDVLGKYIAKADWIVGNIINDEPYCPICGQIVTDAVNRLVENVDEIRSRSDEGIRILIEALLLAGMTIMIIGNTRAVASVEHNIAHYWEMMQLMHHKKPPQHGDSVGVATLLVWPIFTRFAREGLPALDLDTIHADVSAVRSVQNGCSMPMVMKQAMPLCVIMRETSSLGRNRNAAFLAHSRALLKSGRVSRNFHHLNAYTPPCKNLTRRSHHKTAALTGSC